MFEVGERQRTDLARHYCLNVESHGLVGDMHSIYLTLLRHDRKYVDQFQVLNNISVFDLEADLLIPTHDATSYFTAVFVGNNHGSWVDIRVDITSGESEDVQTMDIDHNFFSENLPIQEQTRLKLIQRKSDNFLWFHVNFDNSRNKLQFNLLLETILPNTGYYEINRMEWKGQVILSEAKSSYCVSTPGLVSGGNLNFTEGTCISEFCGLFCIMLGCDAIPAMLFLKVDQSCSQSLTMPVSQELNTGKVEHTQNFQE